MLLVRPPMTDLKIPIRLTAVTRQPLSLHLSYGLLIAGDGEESWPLDRLSPSPPARLPASKSANFPFHQPHLFISF